MDFYFYLGKCHSTLILEAPMTDKFVPLHIKDVILYF